MTLALFSTACGSGASVAPPTAPLQSASLDQLVSAFNQRADAIHTMSLKLTLTATSGKKKYPGVNSFLLTESPASIRIWGTFTLVGRLFDMASDGENFELSLPTRNQFIVGKNNVIPPDPEHPLNTLRPQVIRNALLINPISSSLHVAFDPDEDPDTYDVLVLAPGHNQVDTLLRRITFSRYDLLPSRQVIYDGDGIHATRATYGQYLTVAGIAVPLAMTIERPVEGYTLRLQVNSKGVVLNRPFPDPNTFTLSQPPGSTLTRLAP
ncbi:MAG TPA: hypothetical protein VN709_02730 [Terriglobales bacterium]|nr:hypothetical protein [Terriglobales bacterium]